MESDHAMISIPVDFEIIQQGKGVFKCASELHLDAINQNIIHSTTRKHLIDCQAESDEKQRLVKVIEAKISTNFFVG